MAANTSAAIRNIATPTLPRLLPRSTISGIAEIIPSASAAQYEWEKHGLCSGLRPENYFSALRLAARRVVIPAEYVHPNAPIVTRAADVEAAFVTANPGMSESGIAATCDRDGVIEVRICLTKRLDFRRCVDVDRRRLPAVEHHTADGRLEPAFASSDRNRKAPPKRGLGRVILTPLWIRT